MLDHKINRVSKRMTLVIWALKVSRSSTIMCLTHTQSHICNASVPSILQPASNQINFTFGTAVKDLKRWVCS